MSVRQENRYRALVRRTFDSAQDQRLLQESLRLVRPARPAAASPTTPICATRHQAHQWMRRAAADYDNATNLAEAANVALHLPEGAMDDPDHWVWEEALCALEGAENASMVG